jgi:hypothetical protein
VTAGRRVVDAVGQILANYQAALHVLEGRGDVPPAALRSVAREVFQPVLDACAGVAAGLEELIAECIGDEPPGSVAAERQRVAVAHSRLIRRQAALVDAAEQGRDVAAAARRLGELQTGSHSAGALFEVVRRAISRE